MAEALKTKIDSLEEVPEALQNFYEETGNGSYVLAIDGVPPQAQAKIAEFRENNIALAKQREDLEAQLKVFEGLDADKARDALGKLATMEEEEMVKSGDIETLVQQRLNANKADHLKQLETLKAAKDEAEKKAKLNQAKLSEYIIQQRVMDAIHSTATPHAAAVSDIMQRAKSQWRLSEDGALYAVDEFGNKQFSKGGDEPMSPAEWSKNLVENARHLFAASVGSSATGSGGTKRPQNNPWSAEHRSLDMQTKIFKENRDLAVKMAAEAGITL